MKKVTLICEGVISWMFLIGNFPIRVWEVSWSSRSYGDIIWLTKQMEVILCNWSVWKDHWKPKSKNDMWKHCNSKLHRKQEDNWKYLMLASNVSKWWENYLEMLPVFCWHRKCRFLYWGSFKTSWKEGFCSLALFLLLLSLASGKHSLSLGLDTIVSESFVFFKLSYVDKV